MLILFFSIHIQRTKSTFSIVSRVWGCLVAWPTLINARKRCHNCVFHKIDNVGFNVHASLVRIDIIANLSFMNAGWGSFSGINVVYQPYVHRIILLLSFPYEISFFCVSEILSFSNFFCASHYFSPTHLSANTHSRHSLIHRPHIFS